jgi:cell wall-associated NlpC family hydrolase
MVSIEDKIEVMVNYACEFIKVPYIWGGDDFSGLDCSGFCQECLASVGWDLFGDQTAQALYNLLSLEWEAISVIKRGSLVFFGSSQSSIKHVAIMYDKHHMIEAGGGDRTTTSVDSAIKRNAFVRIRPITNRKDFIAALYPKEGV